MLPQEIIAAKRDGARLSAAQIGEFVRGLVDGDWSEGQAAALAMAIVLRGMDAAETATLTRAMTQSGQVLQWRDQGFDGPVLDKHSTGGVGDKVSLMLAPIVAAAGAAAGAIVPMISGRGLGHTGGTLDKLEALPGYTVDPPRERLCAALRTAGCAIVGAGAQLAPADRRLYAIRDVTATVQSVPLITASILSKKLAAGLSALVLDVKVGSGALMTTPDGARALACSLIGVAREAGLPARALLTDMDRVLGWHAGNALEVREALDFLTGRAREERLLEVTLALAAHLLQLGGLWPELAQARRHATAALTSGAAAESFARMVAALGGPRDVLRNALLPQAPHIADLPALRAGIVQRVDVHALGLAVVALGGGRRRPGDAVDARVGLAEVAAPGREVRAGDALARIHAASAEAAAAAREALAGVFTIGETPPAQGPAVLEVLDSAAAATAQSGSP